MTEHDTSRISPTAHYTGFVWQTLGLAPPELATHTGRAMHLALRGPMQVASLATGGLTLDDMLHQRHVIIDHLLEEAIAERGVGQIIEVAGGLSARGYRFAARHPELTYVEGDLPGMATRKRRMLQRVRSNHYVVELNALLDDGPSSIFERVGPLLDDSVPTAIVTEGLLAYFPRDDALGMWRRFARMLQRYPHGTYVADVHFDDEATRGLVARGFRRLISTVARGNTHVHYPGPAELNQAMRESGFATSEVHVPSLWADRLALPTGPDFVNIVEARSS